MSAPKFSIVIPTRERADTLYYTLRTCLAQQFDDYEIIVCDNCSSPATRQTVESLGSKKIRYIRSDRPLAMSENWELALSYAEGEYVIVIGDDDGLLLHALGDLDRLLRLQSVKVLRWERVYYSWPNLPIPEYANELHIPIIRENCMVSSRTIILKVANSSADYTVLPMLYNSAIHQSLIASLRHRTGRVFRARFPDIYSGFAFAYLAHSYVSIGRPMTINAGSAKSNGVATISLGRDSSITQDFNTLNANAKLQAHPRIPDLSVMPATIAESFQYAKDALFPHDSRLKVNRKRLVRNCIQSLRVENKAEWEKSLHTIRDSLSDDIRMRKWFDSQMSSRPHLTRRLDSRPAWKKGFVDRDLHLDAAMFGVTDVLGVAELCEKLLGYTEAPFEGLEQRTLSNVWRRLWSASRIMLKGY